MKTNPPLTNLLALGLIAVSASLSSACAQSIAPTHDSAAPPAPTGAKVSGFDDGTSGKTPPGFTAALTGGGDPGQWEVRETGDAPSGGKVVAQLSDDRTNARYPHLVRDDFTAVDVDVSVKFKTLSGEVDASGGIVFRYQDDGNYYVVRANSLEGNVVAYKAENGKRSSIGVRGKGDAYGVNVEVPHREWNTLRVIARGPVFEVFLNGKKLFEVEDETFAGAGKVGLWTKADAVTEFDDLTAASLDE